MKSAMLACLIGLSVGAAAHGAEKVVLYGDNDYAPYSYVENGQFKGIYVDILKKAAEKLAGSYQVEVQPTPWKRGLSDLESGAIIALFPPYLNKSRTYIQPYSVPIYQEEVVLFCNDNVMKTARKTFPDDFQGLTIGVNLGFVLGEKMANATKAGKVKVSEAKGNEANVLKLAAKRVDCYANDRASVQFTVKQMLSNPEVKNFKLLEAAPLSAENAYIGYSAKNGAAYKSDFINKMNAALEDVKKSGYVSQVVDKYLK